MTSFLIWMNNKLPTLNFNICKAITSYSPDPSAFAYGFMSPVQQEKIKTATSFCLDATHAISSNVNEILYTLLVRDKDIGRGWPVAFMVTNDRGVSPIVQWLQFLKRSFLLFDPKQFTIDCCAAEVHAIQTTFSATSIQFLHLSCNPSMEPKKTLTIKKASWITLRKTGAQKQSLISEVEHIMNDNSLICSQITISSSEYRRVISNNGAMRFFTRQQKICETEAEKVNDDREMLIVAPGTAEDVNWQVWSFVNENTKYFIQIAEPNLIISCSCFHYQQRCKPWMFPPNGNISCIFGKKPYTMVKYLDLHAI
ncbi:hypothetical protein PHYBLDRAFT_72501 [Phycomyces blakesleeanus NRRL 1555(-)]|uniref:MULE transposase domain-containing protein n=1 Tax=Phycomyces blakesleeanus (strain ATCC 8743b / DSM 1359 / FGSC 10004 / NBRC 33097 / NRRL 1555) TaxID=763407 RepID=A0A167LTJ3_PHYB8|nr:hypothetical protein PHYBLDRAFT_72501 [Phycomyces blakesleeanus NRRL 1555(-)]OAD71068.1 hypothetical protein PHYBLDRAFT_72501 [Phycomyces blakesleeanus NRRL 1555(-)]|eukprot:XP_018289108.1 hypothetical protein PHYBLDRAFT_72501 [Phycomyces blakesleeanus NRRL 1555(-)]